MAPLPQNTTPRVFFDYVTGSSADAQSHTFQVRAGTSGGTLDLQVVQQKVLTFLQAITAARLAVGWNVTAVRFQNGGQNFSVPVAILPALGAFIGSNNNSFGRTGQAVEWTFQGRSFTTGRRVDISLYGLVLSVPGSFRLPAANNAWVADAVAVLNSPEPVQFTTIDGTAPVWYSYVNANYNSYWEGELRF